MLKPGGGADEEEVCVSVCKPLRGTRMAMAGMCDGRLRALRRRYAVYADEGPVRGRARAVQY